MIYVITAVHNRLKITTRFVENLKKQSYKDIHLVLIDDGSTDGTSEMVKKNFSNSTIIYGNGNLWWGGALHKGYQWIKNNVKNEKEYVLIMNDDTDFGSEYVALGIRLLENERDTLITGCGFSLRTNEQIDGSKRYSLKRGEDKLVPLTGEGNCASTRSLFMRVGDWKKIGGFHPILLPHYASDYEFTLRAYRKGFHIRSFENLAYYYDEQTTGDNEYSNLTLKKLFSKRSSCNPVYKIIFIFMVTPIRVLPAHLYYQCRRYMKKLGIIKDIIKKGNGE